MDGADEGGFRFSPLFRAKNLPFGVAGAAKAFTLCQLRRSRLNDTHAIPFTAMQDSLLHRLAGRLLAASFALFVLTSLSLQAQVPGGDDDDDDDAPAAAAEVYDEQAWLNEEKPRIEGVLNQKRQEVYGKITREVTRDRVVQMIKLNIRKRLNDKVLGDFQKLRLPGIEIDWSDSNARPSKSKETIVEDVERQAAAEAQEKVNPDERKARVEDEAEELYKMYQIGEKVSLILRNGRGPNTFIEDKIYTGINEEYVILGNRMILSSDLDPLDRAKFYENLNATAKEEFIRLEKGQIQVEFDAYVQNYVILNTPDMLRKNGYVPDILKPTSSLRTSKIELWMSKYDLVSRIQSQVIKMLKELAERTEIPNYMRSQGFIWYKSLDGKGMEWISEKEKQRREAPPPSAQPGGMDPMMGPPGGMPPM